MSLDLSFLDEDLSFLEDLDFDNIFVECALVYNTEWDPSKLFGTASEIFYPIKILKQENNNILGRRLHSTKPNSGREQIFFPYIDKDLQKPNKRFKQVWYKTNQLLNPLFLPIIEEGEIKIPKSILQMVHDKHEREMDSNGNVLLHIVDEDKVYEYRFTHPLGIISSCPICNKDLN